MFLCRKSELTELTQRWAQADCSQNKLAGLGQQPHCSQLHRQHTQLPANPQSGKREQLSLAAGLSFSQFGLES